MARVLIPFSDPASGERAVRRLLAQRRDPRLEVELLAIVDPLTPGKVSIFVPPEKAEAQAIGAATRWLNRLEPMLEDERIAYRSVIATGPVRETLRRVGARVDIDRVILGTPARDPLRRWRRRSIARLMHRPVVSVS